MKGLGDQLFADIGSVAVGGVDEVDAQLGEAAQDAQGFVAIGRGTPDTFAGDAHGAKAEPVDLNVAANGEGAGASGVGVGHDGNPCGQRAG
jgi:hypothetical protein